MQTPDSPPHENLILHSCGVRWVMEGVCEQPTCGTKCHPYFSRYSRTPESCCSHASDFCNGLCQCVLWLPIEMADARKGIFKSKDGVVRAKVDTSLPVTLDGEVYHSTIRTTNCHILSLSPMCSKCKDYVSILRTCYSRWCKKSGDEVSKFTNNRYLTSPQKTKKIEQLQRKVVAGRQEKMTLSRETIEGLEITGGCNATTSTFFN